MQKTIDYLKKLEWSIGNGQCPECNGVPESWHGHPLHMTADSIGHDRKCQLAEALLECGEKPMMKGDFSSDVEFEPFIGDDGSLGTRHKTADGCPRYKAAVDRINGFFAALQKIYASQPS